MNDDKSMDQTYDQSKTQNLEDNPNSNKDEEGKENIGAKNETEEKGDQAKKGDNGGNTS